MSFFVNNLLYYFFYFLQIDIVKWGSQRGDWNEKRFYTNLTASSNNYNCNSCLACCTKLPWKKRKSWGSNIESWHKSSRGGAFANNSITGKIVIPKKINTVEWSLFYKNNIQEVVFHDNVKIIGESAFSNNKLTSVVLPAHLSRIDRLVFSTNNLTSVRVPSSVEKLGLAVFNGNPNLKEVFLSEKYKSKDAWKNVIEETELNKNDPPTSFEIKYY